MRTWTSPKTLALSKDFGLSGVVFAEHSGQLYFSNERYWGGECMTQGMAGAVASENRSRLYFESLAAAGCPAGIVGMELDAGFDGKTADHAGLMIDGWRSGWAPYML